MSCQRHTFSARRYRGATLVELVAVIVVLSIVVPVSMQMLARNADSGTDTIQLARAGALTTAVCEQILADSVSKADSLGFQAFSMPSVYLDTPVDGLYDRLGSTVDVYLNAGLSYTVDIGPLVDRTLEESDESRENRYRRVTVTVMVPQADRPAVGVPTSLLLTEMN